MTTKKSNVDKILEEVGKLTVLELSELVSLMEETFGVSAAAAVAPQAASGTPASASTEEEKTEFDVILQATGDKKIQVIKAVREITGLGLKESKALVDAAPKAVKEGLDKESAEKIKGQLEEQGAVVEIK